MTECLPDECKIHVASDQVARERMLQTVRVSLVRRQPGGFSNISEYAEELGSVQPTALLRVPWRLFLSREKANGGGGFNLHAGDQ